MNSKRSEKEYKIMKMEKQNEFLEKLAGYAMDKGHTMDDVPREISQAIANEISIMLNPLASALVPFYITAFEQIAAALRAQYPNEAKAADDLKHMITTTAISVKKPIK